MCEIMEQPTICCEDCKYFNPVDMGNEGSCLYIGSARSWQDAEECKHFEWRSAPHEINKEEV